jgi:hypothetical protein
MLRQASYGTIKIGTYQSLKRLAVERPEGERPPVHLQRVSGLLVALFQTFWNEFSIIWLIFYQ